MTRSIRSPRASHASITTRSRARSPMSSARSCRLTASFHPPWRIFSSCWGGLASRHVPTRELERGRLGLEARQCVRQIPAGSDPEFGEHLAQVPFDGAWAEEQPRADLWVRQSLACQLRDMPLLCREFVARLGAALAHMLAGGHELLAGALGERVHPDRREHRMRFAEFLPGVNAAMFATQPLPVMQMRSREL